ncbi:MAG: GGDEF domain-containing protein [Methylophilaceae bacterium]|uniref:GGDEF domain-containing protein n=1 Tax=Methylovorus sp. MM2 TaxID=1848038 RepID=UPI0007DEC13C|nr:GGDEF domain-containing protein [Methylovorus sp. MM2]OAM52350.1 diguanylate cyclase [Methylovorus sp. MM2]
MQSPSIKDVLGKLISLTGERDTNSLEISLAQTLFDLVAPGAVVIYRAVNIDKHIFSATAIGDEAYDGMIPDSLLQALEECARTAKCVSYKGDGALPVELYPLMCAKSQPLAVVAIESTQHEKHFHEVTEMLLQIYQNFIGLINDNERDTLTGLLNRKTFERKIGKVITQIQNSSKRKDDQSSRQYFLAIFDIDHFKHVNDQYGHLIGDEVLLLFSQLMTQGLRDKDLLFRFGGEEFVGVFECLNAAEMQMVLDRFREKVGAFSFPQVGRVTISTGFTDISGFDVSTQLIDRADLALYYAKNHGRNSVYRYETLIESGELQESKIESDIELF